MPSSSYPFAPEVSPEGHPGRVSVVIVYRSGAKDLRESVASVFAQGWLDLEVVVVDNDSGDRAPSKLVSPPVSGGRQGRTRLLRRVRLPRNLGFAAGANAGLQVATGQWLMLLNPDATVEEGCIEALVGAGTDLAAPRVLLSDSPERLDNCGHGLYPDGLNFCRGRGESQEGRYAEEEDLLLFSGAAVLFSRPALARTGGFDPSYFAYGEDADLGLRAARSGLVCRYVPGARVRHRVGGAFGRMGLLKVFLVERNRARVALTHLPLSWLLVSPLWTARRHLLMAQGAVRGEGLAGGGPVHRRLALVPTVLAAHAASVLALRGGWARRRALGGPVAAAPLRSARVGLEALRARSPGL